MFLQIGLHLLKMMMILNQIDVIYVNICLIECFNNVRTCMIEFLAFGVKIEASIGIQWWNHVSDFDSYG